jgi:hypothetical protein
VFDANSAIGLPIRDDLGSKCFKTREIAAKKPYDREEQANGVVHLAALREK